MKTYKFRINGKDYTVDINGLEGKNADVTVNGVGYSVELSEGIGSSIPSSSDKIGENAGSGSSVPSSSEKIGENASGGNTAPAAAPAASGNATTVKSPLPGVIISIDVKEGQAVKKGQKVAVLEAMKMENEIQSDVDGTVTAILVSKGDSVLEGADILKIA